MAAGSKGGGKKVAGPPTGTGHLGWSRRNYAPVLYVEVESRDGSEYVDASDLLERLVSFKHKSSMLKATETTFIFRNEDQVLAEDDRFLANTRWKFRFGYFDDLSPIQIGIVRHIQPEYSDKMTMHVTLFDTSLTVSQATHSKNWGRIPSSEVVKQIAKRNNLKANITPTNDIPAKAWIQPADLNDLRFVRDLAALIDFEVFVDGDPPTLTFRKKAYEDSPSGTITYYSDPTEFAYIKSFKPKVKSLGPYSTGANGTDTGKGKGDSANTSDPSKAAPGIGGPNSGLGVSLGRQGTKAERGIVHRLPVAQPLPSDTKPKPIVEAARQQLLDTAHEASSDHPLTPALDKGLLFEINGIEKPLRGKWYITEVEHSISGTAADTKVDWKRNSQDGKKDMSNVNNKKPTDDKPPTKYVQLNKSNGRQVVYDRYQTPPAATLPPQPVGSK